MNKIKNNTENRYDDIILADGVTVSGDTSSGANIAMIAPSGSGKTTSYTEPALLHAANQSYVLTQSKNAMSDRYTDLLRSKGYKVININLAEPAKSEYGYNPLMNLHDPLEVKALADNITAKMIQKTIDIYWGTSASAILAGLIEFEIERMRKIYRRPNMRNVEKAINALKPMDNSGNCYDISSTDEERRISVEIKKMADEKPYSLVAKGYKCLQRLPERTFGCVIGTLQSALSTYFNQLLYKNMEITKQIDFRSIADKRTVLFITTSPTNPVTANFANLLYSDAFDTLFKYAEELGGKLPVLVRFICDDAAIGAPIPNFANYSSIVRSTGMSFSVMLQDRNQLETIYSPADAQVILSNCQTIMYMASNNLINARELSAILDISIPEALGMRTDQVVILRRGHHPVKRLRYQTYQDSEYIRNEGLVKKQKKEAC